MILIIGLGNPGEKFKRTRHNLGFQVLENFKKRKRFSNFKFSKKNESLISTGKINKEKIILAKPLTFMNQSGRAIRKLINNYKLKINNLIVLHDDIDLPLGQIRIIKNRGSAGHKGVQSIIDTLGTKDFVRFRVGIKPKKIENRKQKIENFVLQKFNKEEEKILKEVIERIVEAIEVALREGVKKAMNEYNK